MKNGHDSLSDKINDKVQSDFRDPDIEYEVMSYAVQQRPAICGVMKRDWLSDSVLQDIYSVISDIRVVCTRNMLERELQNRGLVNDEEFMDTCLDDLYSVDISNINEKSAHVMMQQLAELYDSRRILTGIGDILGSMKKFNLSRSRDKLRELSKPEELLDSCNEGYYLDDYEERLEIVSERQERAQASEDGNVGIPTGIYKFDKLCGGILPGEFGVIGGVTSVGKTLGLQDFGVNAWMSGYNAMIATGEMQKSEIQFRIDSALSGVPAIKFRNAELDSADMKKWNTAIQKHEAMHSSNYLYIVSFPKNFSVDTIDNVIDRVEDETGEKLHWLGIDYLNIMDTSTYKSTSNKEWTSQADVVWEVKYLTAERNLVTWTAGQVTDAAYEKDLYDKNDLKYARAISEAAPVIVAMIRTDEDILANRMRFQVLKMRNAPVPTNVIMLHPNMSIMKLNQAVKIGRRSLSDLDEKGTQIKRKKQHVYKGRNPNIKK